MNPWAAYRMGPSPNPYAPLTPKMREVGRKVPLSILANRLEVDEMSIEQAHFRIHLIVK